MSDSCVISNDRWVASILRQPAALRLTSSLALCNVLPRRLIRLWLSIAPRWVARYRSRVPPILVLVLNKARRNRSRVLLRRVPSTPRPVTSRFCRKRGRIREFIVRSS